MGCKQSKASRVQVAPVKGAPARNTTIGNSRNTLQGSKSSLQNGCEDNRYGSATSKLSKQSKDSGFSVNEPVVDDEPDAYSHIITEESDSTLIQQVEASFQPQELGELSCYLDPQNIMSTSDPFSDFIPLHKYECNLAKLYFQIYA